MEKEEARTKMGKNGQSTREADSQAKMRSIISPTDPKTSTLREGEAGKKKNDIRYD